MIPYFIRRPIHFVALCMTTGVAQCIIDRNIDCELRAIDHMILNSNKPLLTTIIRCDRGAVSTRLPVPWTTLPRDASLPTKKATMQPARRRSTDAILFCSNPSHMFNDDTQKAFISSGTLPGHIYEPRYIFRPNAMIWIERRRRTFALPSSCQKISSIIFLQRQSSLPSPLFPRRLYEAGIVFKPNAAMLAGRRRNMTKHAGGT